MAGRAFHVSAFSDVLSPKAKVMIASTSEEEAEIHMYKDANKNVSQRIERAHSQRAERG